MPNATVFGLERYLSHDVPDDIYAEDHATGIVCARRASLTVRTR